MTNKGKEMDDGKVGGEASHDFCKWWKLASLSFNKETELEGQKG